MKFVRPTDKRFAVISIRRELLEDMFDGNILNIPLPREFSLYGSRDEDTAYITNITIRCKKFPEVQEGEDPPVLTWQIEKRSNRPDLHTWSLY